MLFNFDLQEAEGENKQNCSSTVEKSIGKKNIRPLQVVEFNTVP
jgi:hypothetical protein